VDTKSYTDRIEKFVKDGNYHAALNTALSGMNAGRKENDQACVDKFIGIIRDISQTIAQEFASELYLEKQ